MATIKLDEHYQLVSDNHNWTLEYRSVRTNDEAKEVVSKDEWHYPTIQGCLLKYKNQVTKVNNSVEELLLHLDQLKVIIKSIK